MSKKLSRNELLFLIVFGFWFLITNFRLTEWNGIYNFDQLTAISKYMLYALTVYMLLTGWKKSAIRMIASLVFIGFSYVVTQISGFGMIFIISLFLVSVYEVDYKKVFKLTIVIMIIVMIVTFAGCFAGIIANKNFGTPGRDRYCMGYNYCTYPAYMCLFISFMYMTIKKEISKLECVIICVIQLVFYAVTKTNTTLLITGCVMIAYFVLSCLYKNIPKLIGMLGVAVPTISLVISYIGHAWYDSKNNIWAKINQLLSTRLELGYSAVRKYPITLLGQKIKWVGWGTMMKHPNWGPERYNNVDSFFLRGLLTYGLIYTLLIVIGFSIVIYYAYKQNNRGMFWATIGMMLFGIVDTEMIDMRFQPFVILIACVIAIRNTNKGLENENELI